MIKLLATTLFIFGLVGTASTIPVTAELLSDTGIWSSDTGSDDSGIDSGTASADDTGSESDDTGDSTDANDTGDTGDGTEQTSSPSYSAAQLANDKGGCSSTGANGGPWFLALIGLLAGRRRH